MLTKEALELLRLIPDGYIPLPHQVGGQKHVDGRLGKGDRWGAYLSSIATTFYIHPEIPLDTWDFPRECPLCGVLTMQHGTWN